MHIVRFIEGDSYLHRINPVAKIVSLFFLMLSVLLSKTWVYIMFVFVASLIALFSAGVNFAAVKKILKWLFIFVVAIVLLNYLFYQPPTFAWHQGLKGHRVIVCSHEGLMRGLFIGFRIVAIVFLSAIFVFTTDPTDFVNALMQNVGFSPRAGFSILVALRTIPLFELDLERIRAAHKVRLLKPHGDLLSKLKFKLISITLPLFVLAVVRAERASVAMVARGLRPGIKRTFLKKWTFRLGDWIFLAISVILFFSVICFSMICG